MGRFQAGHCYSISKINEILTVGIVTPSVGSVGTQVGITTSSRGSKVGITASSVDGQQAPRQAI